ncbi:hypothetical protein [Pseudomonas phage PseuP_224]|nr:hypothetical protein [Pseudomonas phage PseuP_224]
MFSAVSSGSQRDKPQRFLGFHPPQPRTSHPRPAPSGTKIGTANFPASGVLPTLHHLSPPTVRRRKSRHAQASITVCTYSTGFEVVPCTPKTIQPIGWASPRPWKLPASTPCCWKMKWQS